MSRFTRRFFARSTVDVARDLLGARLVRVLDGERLVTRIVETEAYVGPHDTACHAAKGRTKRTEVMFGKPGIAYVYFTYGMHWLLNVVTERQEFPAAVLIRAVEPVKGVETIQARRPGRRHRELTSGPARLTKALAIDGSLNMADLVRGPELFFLSGESVPEERVERTPRVGIDYADPEHRDALWRFSVAGSAFVSVPPRSASARDDGSV